MPLTPFGLRLSGLETWAPGLVLDSVGPRESVLASSGSQQVFYNYLVFCHEVVDLWHVNVTGSLLQTNLVFLEVQLLMIWWIRSLVYNQCGFRINNPSLSALHKNWPKIVNLFVFHVKKILYISSMQQKMIIVINLLSF